MKIPRLNSVVEVRFVDHVENSEDIASVILYGKLIKKTKTHIVVETWGNPDPEMQKKFSENDVTKYAIIKKTITEIYQLKRVSEKK